MNETELQRLVVRLVGDVSQYIKAMDDARKKTEETRAKIESENKKQAEGFAHVATAAAGVFAAVGVKSFVSEIVEAYGRAEMGTIKLEAAIRANGNAVAETMSGYRLWAKEISASSTVSMGEALSLARVSESFGLTGEAARKASENALSLSKVTEGSAESLIRFTAAMAAGDTERAMMFTRMIPQLRGVKDETQLMEKYQRLVASGMEVERREAGTLEGQLAQLEKQWGGLKRELGESVDEGMKPFVHQAREMIASLRALPDWLKQGSVGILALGAGFITVATTLPTLVEGIKRVVAATKALGAAALTNPYVWVAAATVAIVYLVAKITGATKAIGEFNDAIDKSKELSTDWAAKHSADTDKIVENSRKMFSGNEGQTKFLEDQIAAADKQLHEYERLQDAAKDVTEEWFPSIERYAAAKDEMRQYGGFIQDLRKRIAALKDEVKKSGKDENTFSFGMTPALIAGLKEGKKAIDELAKAGEEYTKGLRDSAQRLYEETRTPLEKYQDEFLKLDEMFYNGIISQDLYERGLKKLTDELNGTKEAQRQLNDEVRSFAYGTADAYQAIQKYKDAIGITRGHIDNVFDKGLGKGIPVLPMDGSGPGDVKGLPKGFDWDVGQGSKNLPRGAGTWDVGGSKGAGEAVSLLREIRDSLKDPTTIPVVRVG